jgi:hypothetical protein
MPVSSPANTRIGSSRAASDTTCHKKPRGLLPKLLSMSLQRDATSKMINRPTYAHAITTTDELIAELHTN